MSFNLQQENQATEDRYGELRRYGWNEYFAAHFQPYAAAGYRAARVALEYNRFYRVYTGGGEMLAEVAGKLKHEAASRADLPAVGDWVALRVSGDPNVRPIIHAVLPRRSRFVRKEVGARTEAQVVGANIDTVFLMTSLNQDFSPRRIERYLAVAAQSGARPVVVLSKADLCADTAEKLVAMLAVAGDVPVHAVSVRAQHGLAELAPYFAPGQTVAVLGTSGVGKSTLINHLLGSERQAVKDVRASDDRGQHTTRHRELITLPDDALVLDTPGMRELQLWDADEGVEQVFDDIETLAAGCFFGDCGHRTEPRCAVRAALAAGTLAAGRYESYLKLQAELAHLARKQDTLAQINERKRWKNLSRAAEERSRFKRR